MVQSHENETEEKPYSIISKSSAEFIGTSIFVFLGSLSGNNTLFNVLLCSAFTHGFGIAILISMFGSISGGHFNPAVSLAVFFSGKMSLIETGLYIISQLTGGFFGSLLVKLVTTSKQYHSFLGGATLLPAGTTWINGVFGEIIITTILTLTVLLVAVDRNKKYAPFSIGLSVMVNIIALGSLTGGSMNPARSFGPSLAGTIFLNSDLSVIWKNQYIYWVGPIIGSAVSASLYRVLFTKGYDRIMS